MPDRFAKAEVAVLTNVARTLLDQVVVLGFAAGKAQYETSKAEIEKAKASQARLLHDVAAYMWRLGMPAVEHDSISAITRVSGLVGSADDARRAFDAVKAKEDELLGMLHAAIGDEDLTGHTQNFLQTVLSRCERTAEDVNVARPTTSKHIQSTPSVLRIRAAGPLHILLVEDNPAVAAVTTDMLRYFGWQVTRTDEPAAALDVLGADTEEAIDLLFSDVVMPGEMNGLELALLVRQRRPSMPIVLSSGYTERVARQAREARIPLLAKPYGLEALASAIEAARPR